MGDEVNVIEARGLTRYLSGKRAVWGLDLAVPRGSVFALLGRNGAGKTTAIRMLLGLLEPTRGSARVLGHDSRRLPPSVRGRIGYLTESPGVPGWMTVAYAAGFQASFFPSWKREIFDSVADHFRLDRGARARDLSKGQRVGLGLALVLAPEPELLILDDPALGLDPVARRSLLEAMVFVTRGADRTILFSSHLLGDVERVADRIAVIDRGVLKAHCPIETFRSRVRRFVLRFDGEPPEKLLIPGILQSVHSGRELRITVANAGGEIIGILRSLGASAVEEAEMSLEDAFLAFLGERGETRPLLSGVEAGEVEP